MSSYKDAVAEMTKDEINSGIRGCGEIIDDGRLGKYSLRQMMERELAECTLERMTKASEDWNMFAPGFCTTPTQADVDEKKAEIRARYEAMIAEAPDQDEHDYNYYA